MSALQLSGFALIIVSTLCTIISLATDYWVTGPGGHMGLWKTCPTNGVCRSLPLFERPPQNKTYTDPIIYVDCARVFTIATLIFLVAAVVSQILVIWFNGRLKVVKKQKTASTFIFLSVVTAIFSVSIFRTYPGTEDVLMLSWSYFLEWASAACSIVAGLTTLYAFRK